MAISFEPSKDLILQLENISISRELEQYRHGSFRDSFVSIFSSHRAHSNRRVPVLKNINLQVRRGERLAILGPNGAGKSTLCRCAAGLLPPDQGRIISDGNVRAIFEAQLAVQPELTGRENGHFLASFLFSDLNKNETKKMVEEALDFSGLGEFLDAPFKTYSYGMQTRLGLSILSSSASDILILDEVFQGADKGFQSRITARFYSIMKNSGAVIFVSHSAEEVRLVCNRVAVLDEGGLVFDGNVEDGIAHYEQLCAERSTLRPASSEVPALA